MENSKYVRELITEDTDKWKENQFVGCTEWHYDKDGRAVQPDEFGNMIKQGARGRIVERLKILSYVTENDPFRMTHFKPQVALEIAYENPDPVGDVTISFPFDGDPEKPFGPEQKRLVTRFPNAWKEHIAHRGEIALTGQWIKSPYTSWREAELELEAKAKASMAK
jgi:hypothetical protein